MGRVVYLIVVVVAVGMVTVEGHPQVCPDGVDVDRLELPGLVARLLVVRQRDVPEHRVT